MAAEGINRLNQAASGLKGVFGNLGSTLLKGSQEKTNVMDGPIGSRSSDPGDVNKDPKSDWEL